MIALELEQVYYRQGKFLLGPIDIALVENGVYAVEGEKGAGKSTLVKLIGNVIQPDVGRISYFGRELYENERGIRRNLSVVYEEPNFNLELKASTLAKEIRRFEPSFDLEGFAGRMEQAGLDASRRVRTYTKQKRKEFMLILALSRIPRILVMDEPMSEVEEETQDEMWRMLTEYRKENSLTILFTSCGESRITPLANHVYHMENGGVR